MKYEEKTTLPVTNREKLRNMDDGELAANESYTGEGDINMTDKELIVSLKRLKVQTGSLACLGCGREHACGIHGCVILRETIAFVEKKLAEGTPPRRDGVPGRATVQENGALPGVRRE